MKKAILLALLLSGCAYTHEPKLAEHPKDMEKYAADKAECRSEGFARIKAASERNASVLNAFGLIGATINNERQSARNDADYHKTVMEMTDECLVARGYKIAK